MSKYILFLDTETTSYPTDWTKTYEISTNWPYIAQVAWVLYDADGTLIKGENHYMQVPKNSITASALAIHGISEAYLKDNGEESWTILRQLASDLKIYKPLVVGHYIRLDFHMLGADFYRAGISNPLPKLRTFCTMQSLKPQFTDGQVRFQRLNEVYERLFRAKLEGYHNAWADANATAKVFFELLKQGEINEETIDNYPQLSIPKSRNIFKRLGTRLGIASILSVFIATT